MAHINLLPWRAERRKQREREFYGQLGLAFVAGLVVVIAWIFVMGQRIDNQHARNDYLKGEIHQLDAKIAKIKNLEKVRDQLLARKRIIEKLQSNRSQMVHLFDELVETIPGSVRLTSLKQNGEHLQLAGVAQSNASVAEYMRHLAASPWLGTPDLVKTVNHHDGSRTPYSFGLGLMLSKPTDEERKAARQAEADPAATTGALPATAGSTAGGDTIKVTPPPAPEAAGDTGSAAATTAAKGAKS